LKIHPSNLNSTKLKEIYCLYQTSDWTHRNTLNINNLKKNFNPKKRLSISFLIVIFSCYLTHTFSQKFRPSHLCSKWQKKNAMWRVIRLIAWNFLMVPFPNVLGALCVNHVASKAITKDIVLVMLIFNFLTNLLFLLLLLQNMTRKNC